MKLELEYHNSDGKAFFYTIYAFLLYFHYSKEKELRLCHIHGVCVSVTFPY